MEIIIRNLQKKIPINPKRIKKAILKVLSSEKIRKSGEITVYFVNNQKIKALNLKYLHKNYATDVITFDLTSGFKGLNYILADIFICADTAISNAKIFRTRPLYEVYLYVIHGVLHLLGYYDKTARQKQIMRKREREILRKLFYGIGKYKSLSSTTRKSH